jgi:MFS family permease
MAKDIGVTPVVTEGASATSSIAKLVDDEPGPDTCPEDDSEAYLLAESKLRRKVDLRLCTIAGLLCSLNLLDSGIVSSASVTSMIADLDLTGNRYSVAIFIFTVSSIVFQLPSTILVRTLGPRIYFSIVTVSFGIITLCTAFITTWKQMIALRILLGMTMSGIYPGLSYLISTWYTRKEQQLRFAFLQTGEVILLATGSIVNWGLNHLDHHRGLRGWQWMFLVQGSITTFLGFITYLWMVDFPESSQSSFKFLTPSETTLAVSRINTDRSDGSKPTPITPSAILIPFLDPKIYIFATFFFLLNIVSTALSYFLPIILQSGMGFDTNKSILLSAPPYYYAVLPVLLTSYLSDKHSTRAPIIIFNCLTLILGFSLLGFPSQVTVRYIGTFLATGAYISNWAALNAYQANNITGQWKRATVAAAVSACNGLGGIAGSYIVLSREAPRYMTAIWVSIASHVLMIAVVVGTTVGFWWANRRAKAGRGVIEGVVGFRYTY